MSEYYHHPTFSVDDDYSSDNEESIQLKNYFRLLWEQHVYWTRMVILGIAFTMPDLESTTARLLTNTTDFTKIFSHYYDNKVADEFERLVHNHLKITDTLINAAKASNNTLVSDTEKSWYENADNIVRFLNHINSCWAIKPMRAMWHEHLALTKEEAVAVLTKDYQKSIDFFDKIEQQALVMADILSNGIIIKFGL
ncbi:MAG: hypothetical protein H6Q74_412 [Firmicutes bacterium]|nr:hypothetical protein [Bacillota bacterium]